VSRCSRRPGSPWSGTGRTRRSRFRGGRGREAPARARAGVRSARARPVRARRHRGDVAVRDRWFIGSTAFRLVCCALRWVRARRRLEMAAESARQSNARTPERGPGTVRPYTSGFIRRGTPPPSGSINVAGHASRAGGCPSTPSRQKQYVRPPHARSGRVNTGTAVDCAPCAARLDAGRGTGPAGFATRRLPADAGRRGAGEQPCTYPYKRAGALHTLRGALAAASTGRQGRPP